MNRLIDFILWSGRVSAFLIIFVNSFVLLSLPALASDVLPFWLKNIEGSSDGGEIQETMERAASIAEACESEQKHEDVAACILASESHCSDTYQEKFQQLMCFEVYNYWWYYRSYPDYTEVYSLHNSNRIRRRQLEIDPTQVGLIADLGIQIYSIEVRAVRREEREFITASAIAAMLEYEEANKESLAFYMTTLLYSSLIMRHPFSAEDQKLIALRAFHAQLSKAQQLWADQDQSLFTERYVRRIQGMLAGYDYLASEHPLPKE